MAKKLKFVHAFSNGAVGTIVVDPRRLRKDGAYAIAPRVRGNAPSDECESWMREVMLEVVTRTKKTVAIVGPSGVMWRFRPGQRPELVGAYMSEVVAIAVAMETKIGIATDRTFSNGSRALVAIDFSKEPTRVAITLIGEKPDATEAEAWLAPMLRCGEHYGVVGVEEELARAGLLWWRPPKSTSEQAGANGHVRDLFAFDFTHNDGGPTQ